MGDPAGIGPEVVLKAVAEPEVWRACVPVIIGDAQLLAHTARTLDLPCGYDIVRAGETLPAIVGKEANGRLRPHFRLAHHVRKYFPRRTTAVLTAKAAKRHDDDPGQHENEKETAEHNQ